MTTITRFSLTVTLILACTLLCLAQEQQKESATTTNASPEPQAVGPISGEGTTGMVPLFTGTNAIGNSSIKEQAGKIGINRGANNVNAQLHVTGARPAVSANNGTNAADLLLTSGGVGGGTTGTGTVAGAGASIRLMAGNGGNAFSGSRGGNGGSITLQPGSAGTGGTGGKAGNLLLAPTAGNVGIGTNAPNSFFKLHVEGGSGTAVFANSSSTFAVRGNSSSAIGVFGQSTSGAGVAGESESNVGVGGISESNSGVQGFSFNGFGVEGRSIFNIGVYGFSSIGNAGQFDGPVQVNGNLTASGKVSIGDTTSGAKLHVEGGNVFIAHPNSLVITSPNGACWQIRVSNAGALTAASVTCP